MWVTELLDDGFQVTGSIVQQPNTPHKGGGIVAGARCLRGFSSCAVGIGRMVGGVMCFKWWNGLFALTRHTRPAQWGLLNFSE